ncbi:unnamed protein product, partial [Rotaria sp. Silwood2]
LQSDSDFWKLVQLAGIEDKENLPASVDESNDNSIDGTFDNPINFDERIDTEVVDLLKQLSDDVDSYALINSSSQLINTRSASKSSSAIATTPTRHDTIRRIATHHYLSSASRKIKLN